MFKLKRPCANCPFRKGQGSAFRLNIARLSKVMHDAAAFQCHKTVDYGTDDPDARQGNHRQQCAGLMAVLHRADQPNSIMQVGVRFGAFDPGELDPDGEAYDSIGDAVMAHCGREPEGG